MKKKCFEKICGGSTCGGNSNEQYVSDGVCR